MAPCWWSLSDSVEQWKRGAYLHSIQHRFDDAGDRRHVLLVLQVDAVQHHLVGPTDEVGQALVHAVVAGGQRRTVGENTMAYREREREAYRGERGDARLFFSLMLIMECLCSSYYILLSPFYFYSLFFLYLCTLLCLLFPPHFVFEVFFCFFKCFQKVWTFNHVKHIELPCVWHALCK